MARVLRLFNSARHWPLESAGTNGDPQAVVNVPGTRASDVVKVARRQSDP